MKTALIALTAALGLAMALPTASFAQERQAPNLTSKQKSGQLKNGSLKSGALKRAPAPAAPEVRGGTLGEEGKVIFF